VRRPRRRTERNIQKEEGKKEKNTEKNSKINNFIDYKTIPSHLRRSLYTVPNGRKIVNVEVGVKRRLSVLKYCLSTILV
jgi:hypothetical protein